MRIHARDIIPMAIAFGALLMTTLMVMEARAQSGPWTKVVQDMHLRMLNGATMEQKQAAELAGQRWLDRLPHGRLVQAAQLSGTWSRDRSAVHVTSNGWHMSIVFAQPVDASASATTLQGAFRHIALHRTPTPGLGVKHWRITPVMASGKGATQVTFLDAPDGAIRLRVRTRFFALYGQDTRTQIPADARTPREAYFSIERPFTGDLLLIVRMGP